MNTTNQLPSETQSPASFRGFIAGQPHIKGEPHISERDIAEQVSAYSDRVIQPNKVRIIAEHAGDTALSPLIQSAGRNDG